MEKHKLLILPILVFVLMAGVLDRPALAKVTRLTVFYPSTGTIKNLQALRKTGFLIFLT